MSYPIHMPSARFFTVVNSLPAIRFRASHPTSLRASLAAFQSIMETCSPSCFPKLPNVSEHTHRRTVFACACFHSADKPHGNLQKIDPIGARKLHINHRRLSVLVNEGVPKVQLRHVVASSNSSSSGPIIAKPSSVIKASKENNRVPDEKLARLRRCFDTAGEIGIDAYVIPSEDPHQSEVIAECYMRRAYISGFTGSSGIAAVTTDMAALWTDGRYFLQAEKQLGPEWQLMRAGLPGVPTLREWLRDTLIPGSKVGIDPFLFPSDAAEDLKRCLLEKDHKLVLLYDTNLVDQVWGELKPSPPSAPLRVHHINFAGIDVATKLKNLRKDIMSSGATAIIVTMLDEIAWLLNLRGSDIPHSPVTYAYAIVELNVATLFVDESKVTPEVSSHLKDAQVSIKPYEALLPALERLAKDGAKLWLDTSCVSVAIVNAFNAACSRYYENLHRHNEMKRHAKVSSANKDTYKESVKIEENGPVGLCRASPVTFSKAVKNAAELDGMKQAHLRDASAMTEFCAWLEKQLIVEGVTLTEVLVAENLLKFRARQAGFLDTSFSTICGSGRNGAIIHYRPEPGNCGDVNNQKLLLIDSGGQYVDGTTDITRTVHFGTPTAWEKECYTRVLQGHIAIDKAIFPEDTPGFALDILARSSLWKIGLDYRHGTGHGVGAALNVHEGPHSISARYGNTAGLKAGMVVSNEPGYYEDRAFGIRIENLLVVREANTANRFGGTTYLEFERLTKVPIQTKLMDLNLMSEEEIEWVNNYHQDVWETVSPLVEGDAFEWLQTNTRPISRKSTI